MSPDGASPTQEHCDPRKHRVRAAVKTPRLTRKPPGTARATVSAEQRVRFEGYLAEILTALGLSLDTDGTRDTPARLLQAYVDATQGYGGDERLVTLFADGRSGTGGSQIVEGPIHFTALCEHHALPFFGAAWVGYVAADQLIGLSKLTRLVRVFAQRFTMQERLGDEIACQLRSITGARGAAVVINAVHLCTRMRGVREANASTRTSTWRGSYEHDTALRAEFLGLCGDLSA